MAVTVDDHETSRHIATGAQGLAAHMHRRLYFCYLELDQAPSTVAHTLRLPTRLKEQFAIAVIVFAPARLPALRPRWHGKFCEQDRFCRTSNGVTNRAIEALYRRPGFLLRRAHQIAVSIFMDEAAEAGVTTTQYGVLVILRHCEGLDQIGVSKKVGLDRSTTGLVIKKLEDAGLIVRKGDPEGQAPQDHRADRQRASAGWRACARPPTGL